MSNQNTPLSKTYSSSTHRNDDTLEKKWSRPHDPKFRNDIDCSDSPSMTDPSGAHDADINNIVATYHKTGFFPTPTQAAAYADVSDAPSFQEALQTVINAETAFMALDAKTRKKFDNSPAEFLAFIDNPENAQELVSMGLATPRAPTPSPASPTSTGGQPAPSKAKAKSAPASAEDES